MQVAMSRRFFLIVQSFIGWLVIVLQLYLLLENRKLAVVPTIIQFFSYFTILTNILVALYSTVVLSTKHSHLKAWFSKTQTVTALTVYITIVGTVYNTVLRFLWAPKGLQKLADEALHSVIPLLFIVYWLICVPKQSLKWKDVFPWLFFPLFYFVYVLLRGAVTMLYPYPFMDVTVLGYPQVLLNSLIIALVFLLVGLMFIGVGRQMAYRENRRVQKIM